MKALRILQFGPTAWKGGVAVAPADLCVGLARKGHEVGLLCDGGAFLDRLERSGMKLSLRKSVGAATALLRRAVSTARAMKALRILQFGPTAWKGGVAVAIADLCVGLARVGHEVGLLCNGGAVLDRLDGSGVRLFEQKSVARTKAILRNTVSTAEVLRSFQPDIVHVHGRGPSLVSTLAGRYPDCFTLHNSSFAERVGAFDTGVIRRSLSPMGRKVIVLSELGRDYCRTEMRIADERLFTVSNGVDEKRYAPCSPAQREKLRVDLGVEKGQLLVLFVGRFHHQKQPEAIVKLAEAIRARGNDRVRFVMMGNGPLKNEIASSIAQLGLEDRVALLDFQEPLTAYQAADLLVMPSRYEGFPLVAIEAMAAGCPVLRSRTGGFEEMIEDGETGYGCDVESDDFVRKAISILENPEDLPRVAANGRAKVLAEISLEAHARATTEVYRAALSDRRRMRA